MRFDSAGPGRIAGWPELDQTDEISRSHDNVLNVLWKNWSLEGLLNVLELSCVDIATSKMETRPSMIEIYSPAQHMWWDGMYWWWYFFDGFRRVVMGVPTYFYF